MEARRLFISKFVLGGDVKEARRLAQSSGTKKKPRNSEEGVVIQFGVIVPHYVLAGVEDFFFYHFDGPVNSGNLIDYLINEHLIHQNTL